MTAQAKTEPVFLSVIVAAYEAEAYVEACIVDLRRRLRGN